MNDIILYVCKSYCIFVNFTLKRISRILMKRDETTLFGYKKVIQLCLKLKETRFYEQIK